MTTILDTFVTVLEYKIQGLQNMESAARKAQQVGKKMSMALTLPILGLFTISTKAASDYIETINKVDQIFESNAKGMKDWAVTAIDSMGLARATALDMAALFGDMATATGMESEESATLSQNLTQLAADLASFKNVRISMAKTALSGIFTGETESLKRLGYLITEANLKQWAMKRGIDANFKSMSQHEKIMLRYNYIMDASSKAHGDFVRTGGSTANQSRKMVQVFKEFHVVLGESLLPVVTPMIKNLSKAIGDLTEWWNGLTEGTKAFILAMATVLAFAGPIVSFLGMLAQGFALASLAGWSLTASLAPILIILLAVIAAVTAVYFGFKKLFGNKSYKAVSHQNTDYLYKSFGNSPTAAVGRPSYSRRSVVNDNRRTNIKPTIHVHGVQNGRKFATDFNKELANQSRDAYSQLQSREAG